MKMLTVLIKDPDTDEHYAYQVKLSTYSDASTIHVALLSLDQQIQYYHEVYTFLKDRIASDFTNEFNLGDAKKFAKRYRKYNIFFNPAGNKL